MWKDNSAHAPAAAGFIPAAVFILNMKIIQSKMMILPLKNDDFGAARCGGSDLTTALR